MNLEISLVDFAVLWVFWEFRGISWKYLNFAGPQSREISEALFKAKWIQIASLFKMLNSDIEYFFLRLNSHKPLACRAAHTE